MNTVLQRRRTDIKANNATIRRQMNPYNSHRTRIGVRGGDSGTSAGKHSSRHTNILVALAIFLSILYIYHEGGDVNDRKASLAEEASNKNIKNSVIVGSPTFVEQQPIGEGVTFEETLHHDSAHHSINNNNHNHEPINTAHEHKSIDNPMITKTDSKQSSLSSSNSQEEPKKSSTVEKKLSDNADWRTMIAQIKDTFYIRYGGKEEAMAMLERGIKTAADTETHAVKHTAERIVRAVMKEDNNNNADDQRNKFTMSFGGYSVTVGRGNYFHQSYPFILEKILNPLFDKALNLDLVVRNSAIGGIPSFPYGWCLPNFLGDDSDIISWDYGMNEGNGAEALEAYLRQGVRNLSKRPMMIILDNKKQRVDLLKAYYKNGVLPDSIAVGRGEVVKKTLLEKPENERPVGLQHWDEWGAPKGSPGQSKWHPKLMEHELIGWMIAMHFIDAIEVSLTMLESVSKDGSIDLGIKDTDHEQLVLLPEPVTGIPKGIPEAAVGHILYGTKLTDGSENEPSLWHMDPVSCRTNFLPNIDGHMSEIIVSGTTSDIGDDLMDKTDEHYQSGWVIDVGKVERETKRKVQKVDNGKGLGYIDMKLALYGIPGSGTLKFSLPHEGPIHDHKHDHEADINAPHWFDTLVFCEVNEKRGPKECQTEEDLTFIVGGIKSPSVTKITSAASYLKKEICVNVEIPKDAMVTKVDRIDEGDAGSVVADHNSVTLTVDVTVTGQHVNRIDGACSISHVVWQSH